VGISRVVLFMLAAFFISASLVGCAGEMKQISDENSYKPTEVVLELPVDNNEDVPIVQSEESGISITTPEDIRNLVYAEFILEFKN